MATIKEIAKACNVSISTVSNILNGKEKARQETKELVLQKAKEMNYVPNYMAKNLKLPYPCHCGRHKRLSGKKGLCSAYGQHENVSEIRQRFLYV